MRVLGRGNHHRVHVLQSQEFLWMLERPRRFAVILLVGGNRSFEIVSPQITDRCDLGIFCIFKRRNNSIQLTTAIADTDVPQRDPVLRPDDS